MGKQVFNNLADLSSQSSADAVCKVCFFGGYYI